MRRLFAFVFSGVFALSALSVLAENAPSPPSFATLKDALAFIDRKLDAQDWKGLGLALYPALQPNDANDANRTSWIHLKDEREKLRLVDVFADKEFPKLDDTCIIGASLAMDAKLIGSSRIKFIKSEGKWFINAIYFDR